MTETEHGGQNLAVSISILCHPVLGINDALPCWSPYIPMMHDQDRWHDRCISYLVDKPAPGQYQGPLFRMLILEVLVLIELG